MPTNRHKFVDSRQAHLCPYCKLVLATRYSLKNHIRCRSFLFNCVSYRLYLALNSFILVRKKCFLCFSSQHFNNKPFECSTCNKSYSKKADLRKHQKMTHDEQTMVPCPICGKEFRHDIKFIERNSTKMNCVLGMSASGYMSKFSQVCGHVHLF